MSLLYYIIYGKKHKTVQVPYERGGHGGGDKRLHDKIFKSPNKKDPYNRAAGVRDGAMSYSYRSCR